MKKLLWTLGIVVAVLLLLFVVAGNESAANFKQDVVRARMDLGGETREIRAIAAEEAQRIVKESNDERDRETARRTDEDKRKRILAQNTRLKNKVTDLQKTIADLKKPARPSEPDPDQVGDQETVRADVILEGTMTITRAP